MDPFGVSETEARKWQLPTDFWDVMMDPLFMEWIKSIRKEMQGFEENHVWLDGSLMGEAEREISRLISM
jgi:hypothetical protein